jgi:hypothetical protein
LAERIRDNPKFDFAEQDPARCIAAVARRGEKDGIEFLLTLPAPDPNIPFIHGLKGFPDLSPEPDSELENSRRDRNVTNGWARGQRLLESDTSSSGEALPPLAVWRSQFTKLLLQIMGAELNRGDDNLLAWDSQPNSTRLLLWKGAMDPNQKGMSNETVHLELYPKLTKLLWQRAAMNSNRKGKRAEPFFFHFRGSAYLTAHRRTRGSSLAVTDVSGADRHGNNAVICTVLSGLSPYSSGLFEMRCDFTSRNQNGDTVETLLQALVRRATGDLSERVVLLQRNRAPNR